MSDDKRKSPRLPVRVEMLLKQGSNARPVITDNLSNTGAFVELEAPPAIDEKVGVRIHLGEGVAFDADARVVRHGANESPGAGIEFLDGPHADLESFLHELAPQTVAPNATGVERRRYPRFPFGAPIAVHGSGQPVHATGIDASLGGVSLCAERLVLKIGETVRLALATRDGQSRFDLEATVRRTLPSPHPGTFAFGLELTALSGEKLANLARLYRSWVTP
jgi:hypothetical protein